MKITLLVTGILFSSLSFGQSFCHRTKADIHTALSEVHHRIAFKNGGGLLGGGVCWWHSRLQRSSLYLVRFAPSEPKPNVSQVKNILLALKNMNQVVTIGGYDNFLDFSRDHQKSIQTLLERWQKEDGILNFQWIRGISGRSKLPSSKMEAKMRKLHTLFLKSPTPVWIMAQMKGITSHSYLIRDMEVLPSGYSMEIIDSNKPDLLRHIRYQYGDHSLIVEGSKKSFVPYVGFQKDFIRIRDTLHSYCRSKSGRFAEESLWGESIEMGEIEPNLLN